MSQPDVPQFLLHKDGDDVAVAVLDLVPGAVRGASVKERTWYDVVISDPVPLGHKFAMVDMPEGHVVRKYGLPIGATTRAVTRGEYVHTHNVRSVRWLTSRA